MVNSACNHSMCSHLLCFLAITLLNITYKRLWNLCSQTWNKVWAFKSIRFICTTGSTLGSAGHTAEKNSVQLSLKAVGLLPSLSKVPFLLAVSNAFCRMPRGTDGGRVLQPLTRPRFAVPFALRCCWWGAGATQQTTGVRRYSSSFPWGARYNSQCWSQQ